MPELPEVETVRRGLVPAMEGARFLAVEQRRPDLRWPFPPAFAERLTGATLVRLSRRAKYLLAELSTAETLVMHLGMSGSFRVQWGEHVHAPGIFHHPRSDARAHDHVVFAMSSGAVVSFNDPRRFGFMLLVPEAELATHPLLRGLGPEPFGNSFHADHLVRACIGKKADLKATLLDQRIVAGLGNIYVCEALHLARQSPRRVAGTLARKPRGPLRAEALVTAIRAVLSDAIAAGGSTLRDHRQTDGELGLFQHRFRVYDRAGKACVTPGCTGTVKRIVQSARSTFFCPVCQR